MTERLHPVRKGTLLGGRFELVRELGVGGTASVWEAQDTELDVRRAVKILIAGRPQRRDTLRKRLRAEARAMARLAHPNVLTIYDVASTDELDFVIMDLAEGGSLSEWLERTGPMDPHTALSFTVQVLSALAAAHAAGMVHRDVKPQNVLLNSRGTALLADFGIALLTDDQHRNTRTGVAMGSLSFMPPEQRLDARSVSASADVYATGAMLYNLLTRANPVDLFTVELGSDRLEGLPPDLQGILVRATRHDPTARFESAQAMAREIVRFLPDAGSEPYRDSATNPENFPEPSRSLMTGQDLGRTPTLGVDAIEFLPEVALKNPTLLPLDQAATRAAITFLGDDFELYAAKVGEAGQLDSELRGAGLTQVPESHGALLAFPVAPPVPAPAPLLPAGQAEDSSGPSPLWLLLLLPLLIGAGSIWMQTQGSGELSEPTLTSPVGPGPDPLVTEPEPETETETETEPEPVTETETETEPVTETETETETETAVAELSPAGQAKAQASPDRGKAWVTPSVSDPKQANPSARADGPPFGKWEVSGSAGGLGYVELTLRGSPERVQAAWTAFAGNKEASTPLSGKYDPETGRLNLSSSNGRDLKLTLFLDGTDLQGEYSRQTPNGAMGGHIDFKAAQ
ncbi:MAG: serine/threonine protein kinase/cytoskeletal protein RodZ [Cognaticolwellia sp.]